MLRSKLISDHRVQNVPGTALSAPSSPWFFFVNESLDSMDGASCLSNGHKSTALDFYWRIVPYAHHTHSKIYLANQFPLIWLLCVCSLAFLQGINPGLSSLYWNAYPRRSPCPSSTCECSLYIYPQFKYFCAVVKYQGSEMSVDTHVYLRTFHSPASGSLGSYQPIPWG